MACKSATKYSSPDIVILEKNFVLDTICMEVFRNFQPFTIYGVSHSIVSNHDQKGEKKRAAQGLCWTPEATERVQREQNHW